jgi:acylphosphatase
MNVIRHVIVRGRVQGVGYRASTEDLAERLGLEGWVRNRRDGTVEAVFAGSDQAVTAAIEACRQGPRGAVVDALDILDGDADLLKQRNAGERFSVLRTA